MNKFLIKKSQIKKPHVKSKKDPMVFAAKKYKKKHKYVKKQIYKKSPLAKFYNFLPLKIT
jgi:hypothetical protein